MCIDGQNKSEQTLFMFSPFYEFKQNSYISFPKMKDIMKDLGADIFYELYLITISWFKKPIQDLFD